MYLDVVFDPHSANELRIVYLVVFNFVLLQKLMFLLGSQNLVLWLEMMLRNVNQQISNLKRAMNHMVLATNLKQNERVVHLNDIICRSFDLSR